MGQDLRSSVVSVRHGNPQHARIVLIDWMLGNTCNYACSYCPTGLHDGSISWQTLPAIVSVLASLRDHYVFGLERDVWLQFTGGEPTLHPEIIAILSAASELGLKVSLISNGSRTIRFWNKIRPYLNSVILTYHDETADHGHFVEVCSMLDQHMPVHVNVTVNPERFEQIVALAEDLGARTRFASIILKPLRKGFGDELYDYSDAQLARLKQVIRRGHRRNQVLATPRGVMVQEHESGQVVERRANEFIVDSTNRWRGYRCEAGIESLRIKGDGTILRAVCGSGGAVGKVGDSLYLPLTSITCDRATCSCVADILITKTRQVEPT